MTMTTAAIRDWQIDAGHSTFEWAIRHMLVSTIKGAFAGVSGTIYYNPDDLDAAAVRAEIDMTTVDSHNAGRDEHLRSEHAFDVARYPTATFVSTRAEASSGAHFRVIGDLTLHGVTREVAFDTTFEGVAEQPNGVMRAAFTARTTIRRTQFGFNPGREMPAGGLTTSDEVALTMYATCRPTIADGA